MVAERLSFWSSGEKGSYKQDQTVIESAFETSRALDVGQILTISSALARVFPLAADA